ncbi:MAG: hypothetical protein KBT34_05435 [Prevotella sp.]|nr:hypothetical protein [Candidatus Prevotella equi]
MGIEKELRLALAECRQEVRQELTRLGEKAVSYAKLNGNYKNRTGHLRSSNHYRVTDNSLIVENTANYASDVETRGYDVLSGAKLQIINELSK